MVDIPVLENAAETHVEITTNGQTSIAYDFLIYRPEQISVRYMPASATDWVDLEYPTDFTVTGIGNPNGGTIELQTVATLAGERLYLWRDTPISREKDWQNEGDYKAELVNREQDEIFMIMQELHRDAQRAVRTEPGNVPPTIEEIRDWVDTASGAAESASADALAAAGSASAASGSASTASTAATTATNAKNDAQAAASSASGSASTASSAASTATGAASTATGAASAASGSASTATGAASAAASARDDAQAAAGIASGSASAAAASALAAQEAAASVESPVSYAPQVLTPEQQAQARANIGVGVGYEIYAVDFGVTADGATNDAPALQEALDEVAENGGTLVLPAGTIRIAASVGINGALKPFRIKGQGRGQTKLLKGANTGTPLTIINSNYWIAEDFSIDGSNDVYPSGHGFSMNNCNHVRVRRVDVTNWNASAIISTTPSSGSVENVIFEDCIADGLNAANNGFLISTAHRSGLLNCQAINIGKSGSPCYALQLKNACSQCFILGGVATGASVGVAFGQELEVTAVQRSVVANVAIIGCDIGIAMGRARQNVFSNITINMNGGTGSAISIALNSHENVMKGLNIQSVKSGGNVLLIRDGNNNYIEIDYIRNDLGVASVVWFDDAAINNIVKVGRLSVSPDFTQDLVVDDATNSSNVFEIADRPSSVSVVLASDAFRVPHNKIQRVRVDTEATAATDNLATIQGGIDGQIITLTTQVNARDVTVKHATGNIILSGAADFTLGSVRSTLTLIYNASVSQWIEVSRGTGT